MKRLLLAVVLALWGCGSSTPVADVPRGTSSPSVAPSTSMTAKPARGITVTTYSSQYGPMLFDRSGQAIYLFDLETSSKPRCYDECAEAWPPVLTQGSPVASGEVRASLLGTTRRSDGSLQVTYAGHPLYFYAHEGKRQVLCHNIDEYGGLWLVVQPDGEPAPG
jgi:predicted lipoprotein with Yx(FWY)xxD motif